VSALLTHTSWRVYCRSPDHIRQSCPHGSDTFPLKRANRADAKAAAQEHTRNTGHPTDVVRVRFDTVISVQDEREASHG